MNRPAVILVLFLVTIPFSGCIDDGGEEEEPPYARITTTRELFNYSSTARAWTASKLVESVEGDPVPWSEVTFNVQGGPAGGTIGVSLLPEHVEDPGTICGWYIKGSGDGDQVEVGDEIRLTGIEDETIDIDDDTYFRFFWKGNQLTLFRTPPLAFNLVPYQVDNRTVLSGEVWDVALRITHITITYKSIWWGDMRILLSDGEGTELVPSLRLRDPLENPPSELTCCYHGDDSFDLVTDWDVVIIYALGMEYLGGRVVLEYRDGGFNHALGFADLPEDLPP
jgi:hypothetical protein